MVEGGMKCVKYLLFGFNLIFFLAGLGLIIAGALVATKFNEYFDFFGGGFSAAAILLIVVGGIVFFIGFFGCCGAYKENYCMVMVFAVMLGLIFILEIVAGIIAYVMRDRTDQFVMDKLSAAMLNYGLPDHVGVTETWDKAQTNFKCCGVTTYTDWSGKGSIGVSQVPESCCTVPGCAAIPSVLNTFKLGCKDAFVSWVKDNIYIVAGVGIGLAFVQVFGILIACCLGKAIRKEYEVV